MRVRVGNPFPFTVGNAESLVKGSLCMLFDPRQVTGSSGASQTVMTKAAFAGILDRDKIAGDGITEVGLWRSGWFDIAASGAITAGNRVSMAPDNYVIIADHRSSGAHIVGTALETSTDNERILVEVNPQGTLS